MWIIAPASFFLLLWMGFIATGRAGIRESFLYATAAFALCLVSATELLSTVSLLRIEALALFWASLAATAAAYLWWRGTPSTFRTVLNGSPRRLRGSSTTLLAIGLTLATALLVAIVAPPNNWDSMTCHMTRVARWIQEASVGFLATTNHCHNAYGPLTEYAVLHFQILVGGDRFANAVQWFALAGCGVAASLVAREQNQSASVQVLAAVIAVTLPMALLQASNTKDDIAVAFWIIAFAVGFILHLRGPTVGRALFCGLALGFALLTKWSAYLVTSVLGVVLFAYGIHRVVKTSPKAEWRHRAFKLAGAATAMVLLALLVNSGFYVRTWHSHGYFHHAIGSDLGQGNLRVNDLSVAETWTNIVQNGAVHLALPSDRANLVTLTLIRHIAGISDEEMTSADPTRLKAITFRIQEDFSGNFLHFLLLCSTYAGLAMFRRRLGFDNLAVSLAAAVVLAAIVYSAMVKWDSATARYQMPFFMLSAPLMATFLASLVSAANRSLAEGRAGLFQPALGLFSAYGRNAVTWTLLIGSIPYLFLNEDRPIFGTDDLPFIKMRHESIFTADRFGMYFNSRSEVRQSYFAAIDYLAAHRLEEIGLNVGSNRHEYPIHVLLKERYDQAPRLDHVGVLPSNPTAKQRDREFEPLFVFDAKGNFQRFAGDSYRLMRQFDHVAIWRKTDSLASPQRPVTQ